VTSPPPYGVVDVAGIERALFGGDTGPTSQQGTGTVEFRSSRYPVRLRSDGWIRVYGPSDPERV
jgi:hypothetical protein